jgi:hypothetical protein
VLVTRVRRVLAIAAVAIAAVALPASANAGILVSSATDCDSQTASQVFLPWADPASYVPAPSGGFENGAGGWSLTGNAAAASSNEPWHVGGAGDAGSLSLPAGSSATSGSMCVGIDKPDLRFFVKRSGGGPFDSLRVDVLFEDAAGNMQSAPVGVVSSDSNWHATPVIPIVVNLLPLIPGDETAVAFRLVPQGSATWTVDDVYVDPWQK